MRGSYYVRVCFRVPYFRYPPSLGHFYVGCRVGGLRVCFIFGTCRSSARDLQMYDLNNMQGKVRQSTVFANV